MKIGDLVTVKDKDNHGIIVGRFQASPGLSRGYLVLIEEEIEECYKYELSGREDYEVRGSSKIHEK
jgi:hypothetical protein